MSERIDFEPLAGERSSGREDRVMRAVLARISNRPVPGGGLASSIVVVSRFALPAAILVAVVIGLAATDSAPGDSPGMSAARALGVSMGLERLIRQPEPPSIVEMLTAFEAAR